MSKSLRAGQYLTLRDKTLFEYLFIHKIATTEQIAKDIFHHSDLQHVRRRLRTLLFAGYIKRKTIDGKRPKLAFFITNSTFKKYLAAATARPFVQLESDSPMHDLALNDIHRRFISCKSVIRFLTENAIESYLGCPKEFPVEPFLEMHSDAGITLRPRSTTHFVAIEFEHSRQKDSRYEQIFRKYYLKKEISAVIYITADRSLKEKLMSIEHGISANAKSKVFFGELSDVLNENKPLSFLSNSKDILTIE